MTSPESPWRHQQRGVGGHSPRHSHVPPSPPKAQFFVFAISLVFIIFLVLLFIVVSSLSLPYTSSLQLTRPRLFDCCISPLSLVVAVVVVPRLKNQQVSYVGYGHFPYFLRTPTAFPCKNNAHATFCDMLAAFLINVARNYGWWSEIWQVHHDRVHFYKTHLL